MSKENDNEHISVAAYYIWAAEGFPEGMAEVHWERACAALALLADESAPSDEAAAVSQQAEVTAETASDPTTELTAEPAPSRPATARKTAKPAA